MINTGTHDGRTASASNSRPPVKKWLSGLLILAWLTAPSLQAAEEPEAQFLRIFNVIDQADTLKANGNGAAARTRYQEAQRALLDLKKNHPTWSSKVVAYRLKYVGDQIEALSAGVNPKPGNTSPAATVGPQVKLLDAGAEPRRVLRFQVKPGDKQTLRMSMKTGMDMEMAGMPPQSVKMPATTMDMEFTVKDVAANGDISYEAIVENASVADEPGLLPQVAEAIKASFDGIKGLTCTGTLSNRGLGADLKLPPGADSQKREAQEQMQEAFATITTSLPEEPVGPGARWEVKTAIKSLGMTISQTTTYQLEAIEGDALNVKSTVAQHAANQKIQNPVMPGTKADVTRMTGSGSGNTMIRLAQVLPSKATIDSKSEVVMGMNLGGQTQTMTMKQGMNVALETK